MKSLEDSIAQSTKIASSSTVIFKSRFTATEDSSSSDGELPSSKSISKSSEPPDPVSADEKLSSDGRGRTSKVDDPRELTHLHSSHWPSDKEISIFEDKSDFPSIHFPLRYHLFMRHYLRVYKRRGWQPYIIWNILVILHEKFDRYNEFENTIYNSIWQLIMVSEKIK